MKKDQKTLLCEALTKMQEMSGDSFLKISEITRRRVAKGLLYEDVSLDQFDSIRKYVLTEATWDHTNFNTEDEIIAELGRLRDAKDRDNLPSIAYENIDNHINILNDKLANLKQIISTKTEVPTSFTESCKLLESILDPINKVRCSEIFDKNDVMLPKVREYILGIVEKFKEHVNFPLNVRNIYMIGSSTGYQYTLTSDVDIEVELGITDDQKWELLPIVPKGTFLPGTQKPINLFILSKNESYDFDKAENVYDVERNKWLKNTGKKNVEIPYQYIRDLATYFMNGCDHSISNYEKDVRELDEYIGLDPEHQEISVKEKFEAIDRKLIDVKNDVDQIKMAHHVIFAFENEGYDGKPFRISIQGVNDPDPRYSVNNLVYKMIDKHGYHDKMKEIIKVGTAKIKEVEKYISDNKGDRLDEEVLSENREYDKYLNLIKDSLADDGKEAEEILKEAEDVESVNDKTTVLNNLRSDIQDEYTAIKGYDAHADFAEKNGCSDIAKIIRDIRDEEKVHIGELEAVMKKYDKEFKDSLTDGGKEAEEILKEDREYTKYVKGHIKNLKSGYRWLKKYLPEIFPKGYFNDENHKIRRAIRNHDKSKWGKDEYKAYSDFQQIRKIPNLSDEEYDAKKGEFNVAWNHHQKGNRHHWQYWVLTNANGSTKVLDMPYENIIEMICDWWTFSWKENNMRAIFDWYAKNKDSMILSPKTRSTVENILSKMKKKIGELEREKLNEASRNTYYHTCPKCGANLDPGERCDCDREPENKETSDKKHDEIAAKAVKVTDYRQGQHPGQLAIDFDKISESIDVKKEYDGKSLEVELDADLDLGDGKPHHIKSKNLDLSLTKKDGKLDLEVDIETDIKEKNDENIEKYNKKLKSDMAAAKEAGVPSDIASTLYEALAELSDKQIGALIAIENKQNLDKYCENGTPMNCPISRDIFMSIFYPGTEVHDGATIIKDGVIKYSSVFFKNISGDDFAEHYGARHRAAMGLSKETDAFCIVVSEESGNISFAVDGKLEVIKANDVKSSRDRFIKLYNEHKTNKTVGETISEAVFLKEQSKAFGLTTKKEDLPDVKTGEAFKVTFYDNGEYVGEASVSDDYDGDKLCFCYNIEVKKDLRGQGYGTKIMQHMIDKYHIKSLQVAPDNDVAIHLYKKLGFKKTGEVRMSKTRVDDRMELPSKKRLEPYLDEEADPFYMTTDYMKYHILTNYFDIDGKDFDEINMNVLKNIKVSDIKRDRYYMNADNDKLERLLNRTINNMISDLTKKINNAKTLLQSIKRDPNNNVIRTEIKPLVYRNNSSDPDIEVSCGCIIGTEALGGYFTQRFSYKKILCVLGVTKSSVKVLVYGDEGVEVKYIAGTISDLLKNINIAYKNKEQQ